MSFAPQSEAEIRRLLAAYERAETEYTSAFDDLADHLSDDPYADLTEDEQAAYDLLELVEEFLDARPGAIFNTPSGSWRMWSAFDYYGGDNITVQWSESGRCGDEDYYNETFPVEQLWDKDLVDLQAGSRGACKGSRGRA